jgi:type I restriction enzyme S subunit
MGALPETWRAARLKTLLREVDDRSETGLEALLSLRMREGLVLSSQYSLKPVDPSKLVGFKRVKPGMLIMNRMRASIGLFGIAAREGLVSPDYATFVAQGSVHLPYLLLLLKSPQMGSVLRSESRGMGTGSSGFLRLYTDRFGAVRVVLPGVAEQEARAAEAERRTARLNDALRATVAEIDLLKELRTGLIADVVSGRRNVHSEAADLPDVDPAELDAVVTATAQGDEEEGDEAEGFEHAV